MRITPAWLRWRDRVLNCSNPFETRKEYKEVFLTMRPNYKYLHTSFVGKYFKAACDVTVVSMAALKAHKKNL